ncbi:MAG: GGDEF domain-containing protein [Clostridia bacterium]|nr:GGDEF domain-containing protein [Clostridia bacterium]
MSYIAVSFICVFSLVIGIIGMAENELFSTRRKRRFIILASIIIFEIIIDAISLGMDGKATEYVALYKILKITEFIVSPVIPIMLVKQVTYKAFWDKIKKLFIVMFSINAILQAMTFFWPIMFKIEENAIYYRTPWTFIYISILIVFFAALFEVAARKTFTQNTSKYGCTLFLINVFLLSGMIMRLFYPQSNADWLCITIGFFVFTFYFSNSYLKVDSITTLLNQKAFRNYLRRVKYSTAIIVIDANNFKSINDTYGHQSGDWALSRIAELIFKVYNRVGYCYRIGGDEFGVILKPGVLKKITYKNKNFDTYAALEDLLDTLNKEIACVSKRHPMLNDGVSQGYGIYNSALDNPSIEEYKTIEEVLKIADERMYRQKKIRKNTR